jgi:glutathione synthase/RimK-type ligase-like ATP-grasp enzyme
MSKIKVAGIKRKTKFSPNHIGNDGMIFGRTAECLRNMNYDVREYTEDEFILSEENERYIFNMARDKTTIRQLKKREKAGAVIVNPGTGIENCTREAMTRMLLENNIPYPESIIIDVTDDPAQGLQEMGAEAFWIKRGDSHAIHREDVTYARNIPEVKSILKEFALRDIPNAVINEHLVGDLVKFYGVADTDFFYWFYPYDLSHSKFGLEKINGEAHKYPFNVEALKKACDKAGEILDVKVYGGDCVVAKDGSFKIIDFNDWPSFAPCRDEAAPKIAECIHKQIIRDLNTGNTDV